VVPAMLDVGVKAAVFPEQMACVKEAFVNVGIGLIVTTKLVEEAAAQEAGAALVGVIT
jgi:hypothetical protein